MNTVPILVPGDKVTMRREQLRLLIASAIKYNKILGGPDLTALIKEIVDEHGSFE